MRLFARTVVLVGVIAYLLRALVTAYRVYFTKEHLLIYGKESGAILNIYRAQYIIGDNRYRAHYIAYEGGTLDGVVARTFQQQVGLEADEVGFV